MKYLFKHLIKLNMKNLQNFRMRTNQFLIMAILLVFTSLNTFAQGRFSFELRPGVNFATQKLGQANLEVGLGIEGALAYRFMEHLGIYGGWSWNHFGSDQKINNTNLDFEETGYTYGLQFIHPIGDSKIEYLIRAGGLYNHIEVEQGNDIISDTGHGFGWQIEGGIALPFGEKFILLPSVRYRELTRDLTLEPMITSVALHYLSAGIGLTWIF